MIVELRSFCATTPGAYNIAMIVLLVWTAVFGMSLASFVDTHTQKGFLLNFIVAKWYMYILLIIVMIEHVI